MVCAKRKHNLESSRKCIIGLSHLRFFRMTAAS